MGYGRGKKDALREVGRIEEYNRRRKIAASQNRTKKPVKTQCHLAKSLQMINTLS